jgi:TRAP transporter TAXI family solute receptor
MKRFLAAGILISLILASIAFSDNRAWAKELVPIVTPGAGGTSYILGAGIGTIARKYLPETDCVVQAEAGVTTMLKRVHEYYMRNQSAFTVCDGNGVWSAYNGVGLFAGKEKYTELRGVTFLHSVELYLVVRKSSGIRSFMDAKGKRIAVGPPGSSVAASGLALFNAHGLTDKDFKVVYLSYNEVVEGIKDNSIDGGFLAGSTPFASYSELAFTQDVTVVPVRPDVMKTIAEKYLYFFPYTLKKGTYKGIETDVPTIGFAGILATHEKTSPDLVYKLVKALYEHKNELVAIHKVAEHMNLKNFRDGIGVPMHEGAMRYYREVGVIK